MMVTLILVMVRLDQVDQCQELMMSQGADLCLCLLRETEFVQGKCETCVNYWMMKQIETSREIETHEISHPWRCKFDQLHQGTCDLYVEVILLDRHMDWTYIEVCGCYRVSSEENRDNQTL